MMTVKEGIPEVFSPIRPSILDKRSTKTKRQAVLCTS